MDFDLMNPLGTSTEYYDDYITLFQDQPDYMAAKGYSKRFSAIERKQAHDKIISYIHTFDDPFTSFVAMNYFDRYISRQPLKLEKLDIDVPAICCLILALKITGSVFTLEVFLFKNNIQKRLENEIKNREEEIVGVLEGQMRPITAFCFLDFFLLNFNLNNSTQLDLHLHLHLKVSAIWIILVSQREIRVSEYLASVVAASALVVASKKMFPTSMYEEFKEAVANSPFVDKDQVMNCIDTIILELLQPIGPSRSVITEVGVQKLREREICKMECEILRSNLSSVSHLYMHT